jgi:hypothetical protein
MYFRNSSTNKSFVVFYIDDGRVFSTKENVHTLNKAVSKDFKVQYLGKLEIFVGCNIIENKKKDTLWIHQPKVLKHLKETYYNLDTTTKIFRPPANYKTIILCPKTEEQLISADDHFIRSVDGMLLYFGMLLYLIKHSSPNISNAVREFS